MVAVKRLPRKANGLKEGMPIVLSLFLISQICFLFVVHSNNGAFRLEDTNKESVANLPSRVSSRQSQVSSRKVDGVVIGKNGGSRATQTGFFADYMYERENPAFRNHNVPDWEHSHGKVTSLLDLGERRIQSCKYLSDDNQVLINAVCFKEDTTIIAYNSMLFPRMWCGKKIDPRKAEIMPSICRETVKLLPSDKVTINGEGLPPTVILGKDLGKGPLINVDCNVPCQHHEDIDSPELYIEGTDWTIIQSIDDSKKAKDATFDRNAFREDKYHSSMSMESSIPLSHFSFEKFNVFAPPVAWDEALSSGSYLIDDHCVSQSSHRQRWEEAVRKVNVVASYGKCNHNTNVPAGKSLGTKADRLEILSSHLFNLAFEESTAKDFITDQVYEAFESGTLPIVVGASNVKEHFPEHSFISAGDFQSRDALANFILDVVADRKQWESYHTWRTSPEAKEVFEKRYNFTRTTPACRMCRWAYAKKYGLGWNHAEQLVQLNAIPRKMCIDELAHLVAKPFHETWHTYQGGNYYEIVTPGQLELCFEQDPPVDTFEKPGVSIHRQLFEHDEVVDIVITKAQITTANSDIVVRLEFPVKNNGGSYFQDVHTLVQTVRGAVASSVAIQDTKAKITVLASWVTKIWSPSEGRIEITVQRSGDIDMHRDETRRIRVVVEDMNSLHDKVTEYFPSSFGKWMIQDFVDPLDLFYVES